jgi:hypothetical protein
MAVVYLADDLKHDRKVALKVWKPQPTASPHPAAVRLGRSRRIPVLRDAVRGRGEPEGHAGP